MRRRARAASCSAPACKPDRSASAPKLPRPCQRLPALCLLWCVTSGITFPCWTLNPGTNAVTKRLLPQDTTSVDAVMRDCNMLLAELQCATERCRGSSGGRGGSAAGGPAGRHPAVVRQQCGKRART